MAQPWEKKEKKINWWMVFCLIFSGCGLGYQYFFKEEKKEENIPEETMRFLGSEVVGDCKVAYFDTDGDLSTAEECDLFSSYSKLIAAYNLKQGDVVFKNDWTKLVKKAQIQQKERD